MRFHKGEIANNQPKIDPALPAIEGAPSSWTVSQWQHRQYLGASDLRPVAGGQWAAETPDGESKLSLRRSADGHWIYRLYENGGLLTPGGGSNLFLATQAAPGATFDHDIKLDVLARVTDAVARYDTPQARATGAVLAMAFVGLGLLENDPAGGQRFVFMQVDLVGSAPNQGSGGYICASEDGTMRVALFSPPTGAGLLPFKRSNAPSALHLDLTKAVSSMVGNSTPCAGGKPVWSAAEQNVANWRLTGLYAGLEVQNTDHRPRAVTDKSQGEAALGLEFKQISVTMRAR
jgi:hypothetical protein